MLLFFSTAIFPRLLLHMHVRINLPSSKRNPLWVILEHTLLKYHCFDHNVMRNSSNNSSSDSDPRVFPFIFYVPLRAGPFSPTWPPLKYKAQVVDNSADVQGGSNFIKDTCKEVQP